MADLSGPDRWPEPSLEWTAHSAGEWCFRAFLRGWNRAPISGRMLKGRHAFRSRRQGYSWTPPRPPEQVKPALFSSRGDLPSVHSQSLPLPIIPTIADGIKAAHVRLVAEEWLEPV